MIAATNRDLGAHVLTGVHRPVASRDQQHMGSTANPAVIDRVQSLLNEPDGSSSFTRSGYSPGQLGYTTPSSLCPLFRRATGLQASADLVASEVAITSPAQGAAVAPGDSLPVDVGGGPEIATVILVMSQPGGQTVITEAPGPAAHFDLDVPETALGLQNLVAAGLDASGRLVAVSEAVSVDVVVPAALTGITVYPPVVYLRPCAAATLEVTGLFDDGVARDLTLQPGLTFTFATGSAAQSGASGVVLNEPEADTLTVAFDDVDSAAVPIRVLAPDDLTLCGLGTTTTSVPASTTSTTMSPLPTTTVAPATSTTTTTTPASSSTTVPAPSSTTTPAPTTTTTPAPSSTTTPAPSATTTTLAPACQDAAGLDDAECLLSAALAEPLCPAGTIDPKLERFATKKLGRALTLVRNAAQATKPKRQQKLLGKTTTVLGKIVQRDPRTTTDECLAILAARVEAILAALEPPPQGTALDATFGGGGKVRTPAIHEAEAVVLQPDGKLIVAGNSGADFAVARYDPDGSLDASFGTGGVVTTSIGGIDEAFDLALQPDGKIVVVGRANGSANYDFGVVRYQADGSLDAGFGTGGTVTTDFGGAADYAQGVAIQADGKIVVAGHARLALDNDFAVARYDAGGTLDATFGTGGKVTTTIAGVTDLGQAVALQPDGKIVVAGQVDPGGGFDYQFGLVRYAADGTLDASFGSGGTVVGDIGSAYAVAVQPDGGIVVAGDSVGTTTIDFAVARYHADGSPDLTFGSAGKATTDFSADQDFGADLALQPDGRIVVVGNSTTTTIYDLAMARYEADGTLDASFGTGGLFTVDFNGSGDLARGVVIQADGKIVAAGYAANGFATETVLVRVVP